ncbi:SRPBCC family protein [Aliterella atlantica]|uniref:Polyketide cyclase n=1 Tax=Aliterella atlantica CENA595 TaxID=1618023 RepID=A0A0D8ZLQ4_9CYAN|nr:SRPBCC family protein [Aliterella atlantica]KJH69733.1 polyketide cyclase [Aliterella atlantica CENA595]
MANQQFKNSIEINASPTIVEHCISDRTLMHKWLNPALRCEPVGEWSTEVGSRSRFIILIPLVKPTLEAVILERKPGLIVWGFAGFFQGSDRWECQEVSQGTRLVNCFTFEISNPVIRTGFNIFASYLTKTDMRSQLHRLKRVAEAIQVEEKARNIEKSKPKIT